MEVSHRLMAPRPILRPMARLTVRLEADRLLDSDEVLVEESALAGVVVLAEAVVGEDGNPTRNLA